LGGWGGKKRCTLRTKNGATHGQKRSSNGKATLLPNRDEHIYGNNPERKHIPESRDSTGLNERGGNKEGKLRILHERSVGNGWLLATTNDVKLECLDSPPRVLERGVGREEISVALLNSHARIPPRKSVRSVVGQSPAKELIEKGDERRPAWGYIGANRLKGSGRRKFCQ